MISLRDQIKESVARMTDEQIEHVAEEFGIICDRWYVLQEAFNDEDVAEYVLVY